MANLKSLIRLRKHSVEEKQRALAELYRQVEMIEHNKALLIERLRDERAALDQFGSLEMLAYFGRFSQNIQRILELFNDEKKRLETRITVAQDDVREAFASMKRVEIVEREREKKEKKKADDKETRELDEIGIDGFRRKEDEEI